MDDRKKEVLFTSFMDDPQLISILKTLTVKKLFSERDTSTNDRYASSFYKVFHDVTSWKFAKAVGWMLFITKYSVYIAFRLGDFLICVACVTFGKSFMRLNEKAANGIQIESSAKGSAEQAWNILQQSILNHSVLRRLTIQVDSTVAVLVCLYYFLDVMNFIEYAFTMKNAVYQDVPHIVIDFGVLVFYFGTRSASLVYLADQVIHKHTRWHKNTHEHKTIMA